jgi:DNA-binding transcriptional MerR regulator
MAHEIAKLLLEHAGTFLERGEAIRTALHLGMPLSEIEEYLDWLDVMRGDDRRGSPESEDSDDQQEGG